MNQYYVCLSGLKMNEWMVEFYNTKLRKCKHPVRSDTFTVSKTNPYQDTFHDREIQKMYIQSVEITDTSTT